MRSDLPSAQVAVRIRSTSAVVAADHQVMDLAGQSRVVAGLTSSQEVVVESRPIRLIHGMAQCTAMPFLD
jgi:hypothetical protein